MIVSPNFLMGPGEVDVEQFLEVEKEQSTRSGNTKQYLMGQKRCKEILVR